MALIFTFDDLIRETILHHNIEAPATEGIFLVYLGPLAVKKGLWFRSEDMDRVMGRSMFELPCSFGLLLATGRPR